eukprot:4500629-Amphidinium_carterae.1
MKSVVCVATVEAGWGRESWGWHSDDGHLFHGSGTLSQVHLAVCAMSGHAEAGAFHSVTQYLRLLAERRCALISCHPTLFCSPQLSEDGGRPPFERHAQPSRR